MALLQKYLSMMNIPFNINPKMVRGLDYYVKTAFELVTDRLGAASAVGAGGRYDGLVKSLGGKDTPGIGFAIGLDRIVELLKDINPMEDKGTDVFIMAFDNESLAHCLKFVKELRAQGFIVEYDYSLASMKSQFKKADKTNASYAVVLGSNELSENKAAVKDLVTGEQELVQLSEVINYIKNKLI